ncbi:hypothetical protein [Nocardia salmonicida]|uniref:hypothetical protein n=1 Tax=Nocardia salmonicida TaxID=53431 RepID=UPI003632CC6C
MTHSDELNTQPAVRRAQYSGASPIASANTVTAAEATHNQSRAELVRALEAMELAGFLTATPAVTTTEAADTTAVTAPTGQLR